MSIQVLSDAGVDSNTALFSPQPYAEFKITVDNESFQQDSAMTALIKKLTATSPKVTTAAPSPYNFLEHLEPNKDTFLVTISSHLSGAFQNASIAAEEYQKQNPNNKIHVFDSESAASGESLVLLKVQSLVEQNATFEEIVKETTSYIETLRTFFIVDSLDNLYNAGRISNVSAVMGKLLHIVPIMGEDGHGSILVKSKARGQKQAFSKLMELIAETKINFQKTILGITHVNAEERALEMKERVLSQFPFQAVHIFEASSLSTVYAGEGGLVLAF